MTQAYVYAALLIHETGEKLTKDSVKKVLDAAGAKTEEARIDAMLSALDAIDIDETLKTAALMAAQPAPPPPPAAEKKKEEKEPEKANEALEGLGALFG